jgi:hypothetical protein
MYSSAPSLIDAMNMHLSTSMFQILLSSEDKLGNNTGEGPALRKAYM